MWIQTFQFNSSIGGGELPVNTTSTAVTFARPCCHLATLATQAGDGAGSASEAMTRQNAQFTFGDIEPTAVLGRIMNLDPLGQSACFGRGECLVQGCQLVGVEIVTDQNDFFRLGVPFDQQALQFPGPVDGGAVLPDVYPPPAHQQDIPTST